MEDQSKIELFEQVPIPRAVASMSIPTIISSLVMVLYNLADTYFVGMLNDPIQNAAVTLAAPVLLAFNAVNNLFGVGTSSMMSRALGRRHYDAVRRSSAIGFYAALLAGVLFSIGVTAFRWPLLGLLGAGAETSAATAPYMSGCLLNIVLDPIFILPWGLDMGAAGAGLATFLSNCAACLYFFALLFWKRKSTFVCLSPAVLRWDMPIIAGICAVGIPSSIQNLLNVTGMTVLNNFTAAFGSDAVAAMGISQKINMVPMYIAMGVSQGIMPLISYNYGSGNIRRMREAVVFAAKISLSFLALVAAGYFAWSGQLVGLFMKNEAIIAYGSRFLRAMCLALPFLCMDFLGVGVFQSCGLGGRALAFAILRKIVLEIPALYILNRLLPLYGLAYAQFAAELVLAIAAVVVLVRLFRDLEARQSAPGEIEKKTP